MLNFNSINRPTAISKVSDKRKNKDLIKGKKQKSNFMYSEIPNLVFFIWQFSLTLVCVCVCVCVCVFYFHIDTPWFK